MKYVKNYIISNDMKELIRTHGQKYLEEQFLLKFCNDYIEQSQSSLTLEIEEFIESENIGKNINFFKAGIDIIQLKTKIRKDIKKRNNSPGYGNSNIPLNKIDTGEEGVNNG